MLLPGRKVRLRAIEISIWACQMCQYPGARGRRGDVDGDGAEEGTSGGTELGAPSRNIMRIFPFDGHQIVCDPAND